jgi:hypothetical protein
MTEKIKFQKNVPQDLARVLQSYDAVSARTSNNVRDSISRTFGFIETFPEMYAVVFDDVRLVRIKDYPILIQYRLVRDIPVVVSVYFSGTPT